MKISDITTVVTGGTPSTKDKTFWENGTIPWLQSGVCKNSYVDTCSKYITQAGLDNSSAKMMPVGTVIIALTGATVGKVGLLRIEACANQSVTGIIPNDAFLPLYMFYYLLSIRGKIIHDSYGDAQPHISQQYVKDIDIPLPDIVEQRRIVERIEELFSELDAGVETLNQTKEQLGAYRQAVLKEAFDSVDGNHCCIEDVCNEIKVGIVIKPTQYYVLENGIKAFRNSNVRRGYVDNQDWVMISKEGHEKNKKSEVHTGDVLISRSGANLGMAAAIADKFDGFNAIDVVIAVPNKKQIVPTFLACYTNSPMGKSIVKRNERGGAQGHLNVSAYGRLPIIVPSLEVQQEIVDRIEEKLSVCDSIEQTVNTALQQAEAMRQSILKQAFEGRL